MADKHVTVKNSDGTYSEAIVRDSGWSTFWKWTARIIIALVVAAVVIYIVDGWVGVSSMDSANDSGDNATLKIELGGDSGGESGSGSSQ